MHHGLASRGPAHTKKLGSSRPLLAAVSSTTSCKTKVHKITKYWVYNYVSISQTQRCTSKLQIKHATGNRQPVIYSKPQSGLRPLDLRLLRARKVQVPKKAIGGPTHQRWSHRVPVIKCWTKGLKCEFHLTVKLNLNRLGQNFLHVFFWGFPVKTMPFGSCQYEVFLEVQKIYNIYIYKGTTSHKWTCLKSKAFNILPINIYHDFITKSNNPIGSIRIFSLSTTSGSYSSLASSTKWKAISSMVPSGSLPEAWQKTTRVSSWFQLDKKKQHISLEPARQRWGLELDEKAQFVFQMRPSWAHFLHWRLLLQGTKWKRKPVQNAQWSIWPVLHKFWSNWAKTKHPQPATETST